MQKQNTRRSSDSASAMSRRAHILDQGEIAAPPDLLLTIRRFYLPRACEDDADLAAGGRMPILGKALREFHHHCACEWQYLGPLGGIARCSCDRDLSIGEPGYAVRVDNARNPHHSLPIRGD